MELLVKKDLLEALEHDQPETCTHRVEDSICRIQQLLRIGAGRDEGRPALARSSTASMVWEQDFVLRPWLH